MSDSTIANLTSGAPAQASDVLPIQRASSSFKLAVSDVLSAITSIPNGTTATTQSPLSNDTKVSTDAYADAAVAVETSRALTAEALLAPLASPSFTGTVSLAGSENIASGQVLTWNSDTGVSRLGAAFLAIGNGTAGDYSGQLVCTYVAATAGRFNNIAGTTGVNIGAFNISGVQFGSAGQLAWSATSAIAAVDSGISRLGAASLAIGNGNQGDVSGNITATTYTVATSAGAPTSAGTAGTAGQIIYYSGHLYFCSVTGAAGSATWNELNMTAV